jgi:cation diffusion facilitator CzcD-associated flavoprotein CzcO
VVNKSPEGTRDVPVAIVGAGFAGIAMSVALQRDGIEHVLLERAGDVGGTWRDNRYPGCRCDVPSHLYSFSFALNPDWSETYSTQPEIWDYLRRCAGRFGVTGRTRLGAEVRQASWDEQSGRWVIETGAGRYTAEALVAGNGGLSEPAYPNIPGLDRFRGRLLHSAGWTPQAPLDGLRVAVVGTGASAVQIIPEIQPRAARLDVYQRTPAWVLPHTTRPIRDFERGLYRHVPGLQRVVRWGVYWTRELLVVGLAKHPRLVAPLRRLATRHLERQVADPELRAKLTPLFSPGCKRLLLSNDYYPALTRPNVEVVTERIVEVTESGVRTAGGEEREVDAIVLATGFRVTDNPFAERVRGRGGRRLSEVWAESGQQAYRGTTVAGFPNLFLLMGPNTGLGHTSVVFMIESQVRYVADALRQMRRRRWAAVEVRPEVQAAYNRDVQARLRRTVWNTGGCASWYLDAHGRNTTMWPDFTWKYRLLMRRFDPESYTGTAASEGARRGRRPISGAPDDLSHDPVSRTT